MTSLSYFEKASPYSGVYLFMLTNRLQMLTYVSMMPALLVHPYMIWVILLAGIVSHLNLKLLSRWFQSTFAAKGYAGFVELLGEPCVRLLSLISLFFLLLKGSALLLGYVEVIHTFLFPSINKKWLILFIFALCWYVASKGMDKIIRFIVITFFMTIWMILLVIPFYQPPIAAWHDLYPLIPYEWTAHSWRGLLFIWSSLSGPEYLIFLGPWLQQNEATVKGLTYGNACSVLEYLLLFIGSLFFFGSHYLSKSIFPILNMYRYLQSPVLERIDIIIISMYLCQFVFSLSFLLLCFYGAVGITKKRGTSASSRIGFLASWLAMLVCTMAINEWLWKTETVFSGWLDLQIWSGALTFLLVPAFLVMAVTRKGRG